MPNLKFICEPGKKNISFLNLNVTFSKGESLIELHNFVTNTRTH